METNRSAPDNVLGAEVGKSSATGDGRYIPSGLIAVRGVECSGFSTTIRGQLRTLEALIELLLPELMPNLLD